MASFLLSVVLAAAAAATADIPVITRDVAILGGGASGTYAAVRLREDYGKSIVVIEPKPTLGGHVNTFTDPVTGAAINYGVETYVDYGPAKDFFARFNISTQPMVEFASTTYYIDASSGQLATNYTPPSATDEFAAIATYLAAIEAYDDFMLPGYWNFPPGNEIPSDLLLLWPDFEAKYGIQDMTPILTTVTGVEGRPDEPTLFVVMNFGESVAAGLLNGTMFSASPYNNSILYGKAQDLLASDLLMQSLAVQGIRSDDGVSLLVRDQLTGSLTRVEAKALLVSAPPSLTNLAPFGLDEQETDAFSSWAPSSNFVAVVKTNFLPDNTSVLFVPPGVTNVSSPELLPYNFEIDWAGEPNYFATLFNSQRVPPYTADEAKAAILAAYQTIVDGGAFPPPEGVAPAYEIVAFGDHSTIRYNQSIEQLQAGFMQQLYALQGHRSTWYTGELWSPDFSSNVWAFTDTVLPKLLQVLARGG